MECQSLSEGLRRVADVLEKRDFAPNWTLVKLRDGKPLVTLYHDAFRELFAGRSVKLELDDDKRAYTGIGEIDGVEFRASMFEFVNIPHIKNLTLPLDTAREATAA